MVANGWDVTFTWQNGVAPFKVRYSRDPASFPAGQFLDTGPSPWTFSVPTNVRPGNGGVWNVKIEDANGSSTNVQPVTVGP